MKDDDLFLEINPKSLWLSSIDYDNLKQKWGKKINHQHPSEDFGQKKDTIPNSKSTQLIKKHNCYTIYYIGSFR